LVGAWGPGSLGPPLNPSLSSPVYTFMKKTIMTPIPVHLWICSQTSGKGKRGKAEMKNECDQNGEGREEQKGGILPLNKILDSPLLPPLMAVFQQLYCLDGRLLLLMITK